MLRPGIFSTLAPVTTEPMVLFVAPGVARPMKEKSVTVIIAAGLQVKPFTLIAACRGKKEESPLVWTKETTRK